MPAQGASAVHDSAEVKTPDNKPVLGRSKLHMLGAEHQNTHTHIHKVQGPLRQAFLSDNDADNQRAPRHPCTAEEYAKHFGLVDIIRFDTKIEKIKQVKATGNYEAFGFVLYHV